MVPTYSILNMNNVCWYVLAQQLTHCYVNLWLLFWTRQDRERFYVSSATMVIKTELCQYTEFRFWTQISRVHSPVVKAADCRSAGPWFNSGRRIWFTFVTWYDKLTNHDFLMINIMSPITTSCRTITRKSVNMVAELRKSCATDLWTAGSIGQRLEGNSVVTKVLHAIALKTPSEFGSYTVVDWMQWFGVPTLALGSAAVRMPGLQTQEQHFQLHEDQLTTEDLKMTEDALAEARAAFEDTMQDCLAIQTKAAEFEAYTNKSLSEELEAFAKAKAVISEKTVLSSRRGLAGELIKSENSIELEQLASRVDSAMHCEISNGDDFSRRSRVSSVT